MALNEQQLEAIQEDIKDERSKKERIDDQMDALKSVGKFAAETAVESIPGVGQAIGVKRTSDALEEDDYVGAGIEGTALAASLVPGVGPAIAKGLRKFNKTRKAYKLFVKGEDGELYPLFVDANKPVKQGEFLEANFPDVAFKGKRKEGSKESFYVPTKGAKRSKGEKAKGTGDSIIIPDEATRQKLIDEGFITEKTRRTKEAPFGKVTAVAARPGWHASQAPVATHLGPQDLKVSKKEAEKLVAAGVTPEAIKRRGNQFYVKRRAEDQVFAEVDMADDVDYQSMLAKEGRSDINDRVPKGGSYKYSDGQADSDQWVVGGDMKVNRVLSREETRAIQKEMGVVDLPYRDEVETILGRKFSKGGVVMDDYLIGKMMDDETSQKFAKGGMPKQMEMFEDGGLKDEGGTVDPESGNEVPTGSTQEEVRDDIPAQLSEGEFVLPADVVRYHGLDKIMRLRDEAKAGLQRMEAMGQMGNSEEATIPDGIPFDINDLDMEDDEGYNYQVGGLVPPQGSGIAQYQPSQFQAYQPQYTPYQATPMQAAYQPPQAQAVPTMQAPVQMPTFEQFTQPPEGTAPENREYINPTTGERRIFTFIGGNPTTQIPEGFIPVSEYTEPPATEVTTTPTVGQTRVVETDDSAAEERRRREEEMYGPGGGRLAIGGRTYGVSFDTPDGTLPGVAGTAKTLFGLVTGGGIDDAMIANIQRGDNKYSLTGTDYNKLKAAISDFGANSTEAEQAFKNGYRNYVDLVERAVVDAGVERKGQPIEEALKEAMEKTGQSRTSLVRGAQVRKDVEEHNAKVAAEAARKREQEQVAQVVDEDREQPSGGGGSVAERQQAQREAQSFTERAVSDVAGRVASGRGFNKGGDVTKQMKKSGLTSKK